MASIINYNAEQLTNETRDFLIDNKCYHYQKSDISNPSFGINKVLFSTCEYQHAELIEIITKAYIKINNELNKFNSSCNSCVKNNGGYKNFYTTYLIKYFFEYLYDTYYVNHDDTIYICDFIESDFVRNYYKISDVSISNVDKGYNVLIFTLNVSQLNITLYI
jgi:hypothetical protein